MSVNPEYSLSFSLNVLHHLGIGLYSKISAILSEFVANAWDSGATKVDILLETDRIVIADDGCGMSRNDINEKFLRIGYQKRRNESVITVNGSRRHVMGRKGIGKLSVFSIANLVEVKTVRDGEKRGFVMRFTDIEEAIANDKLDYYPKSLPEDEIEIERGTRIVLTHLRQALDESEDDLRVELARRFTIIGSGQQFDVYINGRIISIRDRNYYDKIQFVWYLGAASREYAERCVNRKHEAELSSVVATSSNYSVNGWLATVEKPSDIDDRHHAISIFAHGKLIQEDILAEIQEARIVKQYLFGEIDADFMDDDELDDIVTSDRQRINQNDPRYHLLREYVKQRVKEIANRNQWTKLRSEYGNRQIT